jgi:hypothetical protein
MGKVIGCGFCPETANITGEHLWSDWFGRGLGDSRVRVTREVASGEVKQWTKKKLDEKANVVCQGCNNGWMSDLEGKTKLVIGDMALNGTAKVLQPAEVKVLAAFGFKCAVVTDLMHGNRSPFFSRYERWTFARTLAMPPYVQMWVGRVGGHRGVSDLGFFSSPKGVRGGFELAVFTYSIGQVLFQVVAPRWDKKGHRRRSGSPVLSHTDFWDTAMTQFWPNSGKPVTWPPPIALTESQVDGLVRTWGTIQIPVEPRRL